MENHDFERRLCKAASSGGKLKIENRNIQVDFFPGCFGFHVFIRTRKKFLKMKMEQSNLQTFSSIFPKSPDRKIRAYYQAKSSRCKDCFEKFMEHGPWKSKNMWKVCIALLKFNCFIFNVCLYENSTFPTRMEDFYSTVY